MIIKPHEPSSALLLWLSLILIMTTPILWYFLFYAKLWPTYSGSLSTLNTQQAIDCLSFWKIGLCRSHLEGLGTPLASNSTKFQAAVSAPALVALALIGYAIYEKFFVVRQQVIVSGMVVEKMQDLLAVAKREQKKGRFPKIQGIHLFNGWHYNLARETAHTFVIGAPGGGKTVTIRRMIDSVVARGDKAIIFDEKGDYTKVVQSTFVDGVEKHPVILAPQDSRSAVWDIAKDLIVPQDAIELAQRLIPDTANPFFTQSAKAILAGCAIKLMAEKPKQWTWQDLLNETRQDHATLLKTMLRYQRGSDIFLIADIKQVMSTLGQLETSMRLLEMLATAWPTYEDRKLFSIRDWLAYETEDQTVILQHSGRYSALSDGWISALYAVAVSTVTDNTLLDDNPLRRIWFFLDEWGQLPAIYNFERFITLGRSKGVCVVLGLQDLAQIVDNYSREVLDMLMASVGTKIITRINLGPTAQRMEEEYGVTTFYDYQRDMQTDGSLKWRRETHRTSPILRNEFQTELGADGEGVQAFISGIGKSIYHVKYGFPEGRSDWRPATEPAEWTYKFKPLGTFTNEADIDKFVKDALGDKKIPMRGKPPVTTDDMIQVEDDELEADFNQAVQEMSDRNEKAMSDPDEDMSADPFQTYQ